MNTVLVAITLAYGIQHQTYFAIPHGVRLLLLGAAAYLLANTVLVAGIMCLTNGRTLGHAWAGIFSLTYLYFVLGAAIAAVIVGLGIRSGVLLLTLVVMYGAYRSFHLYFVTMGEVAVPQMASVDD